MLVLSRTTNESICVGNGIVVTVLSSQGGRVRLGIEAPREVSIDRGEVRERRLAELHLEIEEHDAVLV